MEEDLEGSCGQKRAVVLKMIIYKGNINTNTPWYNPSNKLYLF